MRIGLVIEIHGSVGNRPGWKEVLAQARAAEAAGIDLVVLEDALLYRDETRETGYWEAVSVAAALAASTERIEIGHSVINDRPFAQRAEGVAAMAAVVERVHARG